MPKDRYEKLSRAFSQQVMPLFEVWCRACELTPIEADILFYKMFDDSKLNEQQIIDILAEKYGYYYCDREFRRFWRKIKRKIESILP